MHNNVITSYITKCKTGDLTDVKNYRAIALSNAISKILEHILYDFIASEDAVDDFQFGFKKGHSTSDCTFVLKNTIDYYHDASFLRFDIIPECDGRTDRQTDRQTDIPPLAIPAVCIARYANTLVKTMLVKQKVLSCNSSSNGPH